MNLFSKKTTTDDFKNHIIHSLFIHNRLLHKDSVILDAGTGGGLPGLPLAISNPDKLFYLADCVQKKILALKNTVNFLDIGNTYPVLQDVFSFNDNTPCVIVSKHAFSLSDLLKVAKTTNCKRLLILKGSDVFDQISDLNSDNLKIHLKKLHWHGEFFFQNKFLAEILISDSNEQQ